MSTLAKKLNTGLNLSSKLAVVAGGSQGIGAGIAVRLAEAGSSVIVVGRSESRMTHVINECKRVSPNGPSGKIFDFISADLGAAAGIKEAISEIKAKSNNSVNYLFTTQGGPPNGSYTLNADGVESGFAVQVMGRFAMNQQLAEAGVLKEASVSVAAPGGSQTEYDVDDIEVRSVRGRNAVSVLLALAKNQGLVTDAATKALQSRYPSIAFFHVFPGIVTTNGAANQGFPFPLPQLFALASPVISRTVGNSPQSYADIPVLLAANTGAEKQEIVKREGNFLGQTLKRIQPAPWTEDKANQDKIYEKLRSYY